MKLDRLVNEVVAPSIDEICRFERAEDALGDADAIHRLRVATRRMRSDLRTFRRAFDETQAYRTRGELRWLGSRIGAVRDLDVLDARIRAHEPHLADEDRAACEHVARLVSEQRSVAEQALRDAIASERFLALKGDLENLREPTGNALPASASEHRSRRARVVVKRVASSIETLDAAVDALVAVPSSASLVHPPDEDLHRIRILTKRARYACEASASVVGEEAHALAHALAGVQTLLGAHQDAVFAENWMRRIARSSAACRFVTGEFSMLERLERARCRGAWHDAWRQASKRGLRWWT